MCPLKLTPCPLWYQRGGGQEINEAVLTQARPAGPAQKQPKHTLAVSCPGRAGSCIPTGKKSQCSRISAAAAAKSLQSDSVRPQRRQPTRLPRPRDSSGKNTGVGFHFLLQCMKVKSESEVAQSCPTLRPHR